MAIKIAVDSNIIIALSKYMDPKFDPDNEIHNAVKKGSAHLTMLYKDKPFKELPPLLQDNYLGKLERGIDNNYYFARLTNISKLAYSLKKGTIEICATPLVFLETNKSATLAFYNKYCTILTVADNDAIEFFRKRDILAEAYTKGRAMDQILNGKTMETQPSNDAYIMAEASMFGLDLVTANEKHFVHVNVHNKDYKLSNRIQTINEEFGLCFKSNIKGKVFIPTSRPVDSMVSKVTKYVKDPEYKSLFFANSANIDENNQYHLK